MKKLVKLYLTTEEFLELERQMQEEGLKTIPQLLRRRTKLGITKIERDLWHIEFKKHNKNKSSNDL